jgi:hypothetical protein
VSIRPFIVVSVAVVTALSGGLAPAYAVTVTASSVQSPWSVAATPQPLVRQASLAGVACPRPRMCIAVGQATDRHGRGVALAEFWDGSDWSVIRLQTPPGARSANALGIACSGSTFCMAVGGSTLGTLAEVWDGATWSLLPTPGPPGGGPSVLRGVACASPSMCVAVGDHDPRHGPVRPLIDRWDGSAWSAQTPAIGSGSLAAVACPAAETCMAVGRSAGTALAETWDGATWRLTDARTQAALSGVACPAPALCVATGSYRAFRKPLAVIERWDGSHWSLDRVDWPLKIVISRLNAVACTSADACTAAGFAARQGRGVQGTLVVRWNGSVWSVDRTPNDPHAAVDELEGVSCTSASHCSAVGTAQTKRRSQQLFKALALAGDGSTWTLTTPINPRGAESAALAAVSCVSATFCMAVGSQWSSGLPGAAQPSDAPLRRSAGTGDNDESNERMSRVAFAERWDGRRWSLVPIHAPPGFLPPLLFAVSCTSPQFCMAVGAGGTRQGQTAVAEVWDGRTWSSATTPSPRSEGELLGVSCSSPSLCIAVGDDGVFPQDLFPLALRWDGQMWTEMKTPRPARFSSLESVSCASDRWCMAVGSSQSSIRAPYRPLTERLDGRRWTVMKARSPRGAGGAIFEGVSCASVDQCMAVGSTNPHSDDPGTLADIWNGRSWRSTEAPTGRSEALYGVACPTADLCVAVGVRPNGPLAEVWSNRVWTVSRTEDPSHDAWFTAVSCIGVDDCTAAGLWFDGSFAHTLAERYRG